MGKLEVRLSGQQLEVLRERASGVGLSVSAFVRRELGLEGVEQGQESRRVSGSSGAKGPMSRSDAPVSAERPSQAGAFPQGDGGTIPAPFGRFRCPGDCDPSWRPASPAARCPSCRRETVPA